MVSAPYLIPAGNPGAPGAAGQQPVLLAGPPHLQGAPMHIQGQPGMQYVIQHQQQQPGGPQAPGAPPQQQLQQQLLMQQQVGGQPQLVMTMLPAGAGVVGMQGPGGVVLVPGPPPPQAAAAAGQAAGAKPPPPPPVMPTMAVLLQAAGSRLQVRPCTLLPGTAKDRGTRISLSSTARCRDCTCCVCCSWGFLWFPGFMDCSITFVLIVSAIVGALSLLLTHCAPAAAAAAITPAAVNVTAAHRTCSWCSQSSPATWQLPTHPRCARQTQCSSVLPSLQHYRPLGLCPLSCWQAQGSRHCMGSWSSARGCCQQHSSCRCWNVWLPWLRQAAVSHKGVLVSTVPLMPSDFW